MPVDGSREYKDVVAGRDYILRGVLFIRWIWEDGLRCFFWRCPREFRRAIIDGQKQWQVNVSKVCSATYRMEGCTDSQERSEEVVKGLESRLHK